jgi:aminomethyltransferase
MPVPTPFHERTAALCNSYAWKEWAGYYTPVYFDMCHEPEYMAFRHSAGLFDATPLYKYDITGKDAAALLAKVTVKNVPKLKVGQVTYTCWCDGEGKILDDGTITRLGEEHFRLTAAAPTYYWLERHRRGFTVEIKDMSTEIATLALQGPFARHILKNACDADLDKLRFFRAIETKMDGFNATITRTGYTGDLGYEIWADKKDALKMWDTLWDAGKDYNLRPAGIGALDMARVEAGFIMLDVDYFSSKDCLIESRKSTPYELDLGWTINLERDPFIGQKALQEEKAKGSKWQFVGLEYDWPAVEKLFNRFDLPPQTPSGAWRTPTPVYCDGLQVGQATSGTWSPILKKNLALTSVLTPYAELGSELQIEMTAEFERHKVGVKVVKRPFFDPERKRSTPGVVKKKKSATPKGEALSV